MKARSCLSVRSPAGFTLVELLTVIAIIGVLVAITIPVVGGMRKKAHTSKATSNIRHLVIANLAYASEHKGKVPPRYKQNSDPTWQVAVAPYLGTLIPSLSIDIARMRRDPETIFNVPDSKPYDERGAAAASIARNWLLPSAQWNYQMNVVSAPARIILLGECEEKNFDEVSGLREDLITAAANSGTALPGFRRDNETKALMGYCDGHVQALTRTELVATGTFAEGNRWRWW